MIALALADGRLDSDGAWACAHVDYIYQGGRYAEDPFEAPGMAALRYEIAAAARVFALCRADETAP